MGYYPDWYNMHHTPEDILDFWFSELSNEQWFAKDLSLDQKINQRFGGLLHATTQCENHKWRATPRGRLAEIIILDQFSRNIYRNDKRAFTQDSMALALSQEAIALGYDKALPSAQKAFLYMPFMHSESKYIHELALPLFSQPGLEKNLEFELKHKNIIDRFDRYPHRNLILGRTSTAEEIEFLKQSDSAF